MNDIPKIGDAWVGEGNDGNPITRKVTAVKAPENPWDDWQVSLAGGGLAHRGWWYGQGWTELEDE